MGGSGRAGTASRFVMCSWKKKSMAKNDTEMPSNDFENIDLRKKFIVFGMAAMPFPQWFGDCFHGKSLSYLY